MGFPSKSAPSAATVTVQVQRNLNAPEFVGIPYQPTILSNVNIDESVFQITTRDLDTSVSICVLLFMFYSKI